MSTTKRAYRLGARAEASEARKERILMAAFELLSTLPDDQVSLAMIAERAEVSLKTVVRAFASKEELILAGARWSAGRERARRHVAVGDVPAAVRTLTERYEELGERFLRRVVLEQRVPALRELGARARASHMAWLGEVFAPWLPARAGRLRTRRLMALFGATEIYVWSSWRRDFGLPVDEARRTMRESIEALLAQFQRVDRDAGKEA